MYCLGMGFLPIVKHKANIIMNLKHMWIMKRRKGMVLMPTP